MNEIRERLRQIVDELTAERATMGRGVAPKEKFSSAEQKRAYKERSDKILRLEEELKKLQRELPQPGVPMLTSLGQ